MKSKSVLPASTALCDTTPAYFSDLVTIHRGFCICSLLYLVFSTSISFPGWFLLVILDSPLAWRIPRTGEPGGLPFMGSHRVGHDWSDLAAAAAIATFIESPFLINWSKKAKQFLFHIIYHSLKSSCYFILFVFFLPCPLSFYIREPGRSPRCEGQNCFPGTGCSVYVWMNQSAN